MTRNMVEQKEKKYAMIIGSATLTLLICTIIIMLFFPHLSMPQLGKYLSEQLEYSVDLDSFSEKKLESFNESRKDIEKLGDEITLAEEFELVTIYLKYDKYAGYGSSDVTYIINMSIFIAFITITISITVVASIFTFLVMAEMIGNNKKRIHYIKYIQVLSGVVLILIVLLSFIQYEGTYGEGLSLGTGIWLLGAFYAVLLIGNRIFDYKVEVLNNNNVVAYVRLYKSFAMSLIAFAIFVTYFLPNASYPRGVNQCIESIDNIVYYKLEREYQYDVAEESYEEFYFDKYEDFDDFLDEYYGYQEYLECSEDLSTNLIMFAVVGLIIIFGVFSAFLLFIRTINLGKNITSIIIINFSSNVLAFVLNTVNSNRNIKILNRYYENNEWDLEASFQISIPMIVCMLLGLLMLSMDLWSKRIEKKLCSMQVVGESNVKNTNTSYMATSDERAVTINEVPNVTFTQKEKVENIDDETIREAEKKVLLDKEKERIAKEEAFRKAEEYARLAEEIKRNIEELNDEQVASAHEKKETDSPRQGKKISFCKECGNPISDTAKYCMWCGNSVNIDE